MNPCVPKGVLLILLATVFSSNYSFSQCLCEGGKTPKTIVHTASLDSVTLTTTMPIPKFPTDSGTLICVNLQSSISSIMSFDLVNKVSEPFTYNMLSNLTATVSGPGGLSVSANSSASYGPFDLGPFEGGADFVHYGPDTLFNNVNRQRTVSNVLPYTGTGTVNLMFDLSGPVWASPSSGNYGLDVKTYSNIDVTITYSWCDNSVLAENFKSFSAIKHGDVVDLEWLVADDKKSNTYEIQISYDGRNFQKIGERNGNAAEGAATKHLYQYHIDKSAYRKAYFRIKQSSQSISYSGIRAIELGQDENIQATVYPNPAVRIINLAFREPLTGEFNIRVSNQLGQALFVRNIKMNNTTSLQLPGELLPAEGIYYVTARETTTGRAFTSKLLFRK